MHLFAVFILNKVLFLASKSLSLALNPVAKFIVPDWGDKVDYGIGFSYRPARLHRLAGPLINTFISIFNPNIIFTFSITILSWNSR